MALFRCPHCEEIIWQRSPRLKQIWDIMISKKETTTSFVADSLGITIQAANNQLNKLKSEGMIDIEVTTHPTGGLLNIWKLSTPTPEDQ